MANDDIDWVADVRRWCLSNPTAAHGPGEADADAPELGYEAAQPALQSRHWPDAPHAGEFVDRR